MHPTNPLFLLEIHLENGLKDIDVKEFNSKKFKIKNLKEEHQ